jgi:DNA recombination protein RmuC
MDTVLLITAIVVGFLALAITVILLIVVLKDRKAKEPEDKTTEYFNEIKQSLQTSRESLPLVVSGELAKQMVGIQKQLGEQAETDHKRLNEFQTAMADSLGKSMTQMNTSLNDRVDKMNESLTKSVTALNEKVDKNLADLNKQVGETLTTGFKGNSETMGELKEKLGKIDEAQKHLESLQNEVVTLNNVLANNQARGQYGELQLEMLLEATFPNGKGKFYNLQDDLGRIKDGEKVRPDADIVFTTGDEATKLCIDSKFPFSDYVKLFSGEAVSEEERRTLKISFKNAVRTKADSIAEKYIISGVTMKYAIMFVPNDGVFAFIENEFPELVSLARNEGVIISGPSTLQAIIVVFHGAAIDAERSKDLEAINVALKGLGDEFNRFSKRWAELEKSIDTVDKKSKDFSVTVGKISNKFGKINHNEMTALGETGEDDTPVLEAPADEEGK